MIRGIAWMVPGVIKHLLICSWRGHRDQHFYRYDVCLRCGRGA